MNPFFFSYIYQSLEKYEVRNTVSMVDPRKRVDERDLDKEEQDYFNGDRFGPIIHNDACINVFI